MANTATNVTTGRPNIAGGVYVAPLATTLPTDATTALDAAFQCLGYVSEDGLENSNDLTMSDIKEWGGSIVYRSLTEMVDNFKLTLIESENEEVLKAVYGSANVTSSSGAITVDVKTADPEELVWVFELSLRGEKKKRIVIPDGAVTSRDAISYTAEDAIGYGITVSAYPDANGSTHKEYIA